MMRDLVEVINIVILTISPVDQMMQVLKTAASVRKLMTAIFPLINVTLSIAYGVIVSINVKIDYYVILIRPR